VLIMFTYFGEFDRTLSLLDDFRQRMDRVFDEVDTGRADGAWPRANLFDSGSSLLLKAELPGVADKDVQITMNQDVLTLSGERKSDAPDGYSVHRRERAPLRFARSFSFPCKVDPEKVTATIKHGILSVEIAKAPEAQPRQIAIRAS